MTLQDEFPELTQKAKCVLMSTMKGIDVSRPCWDRRFAAAVIREVMVQVGYWNINSDFPRVIRVINAKDLDEIADNLHPLAPPPPTREQMEIALGRLLRHTNDPAGCHEGSLIAELANVLRRGIAHHWGQIEGEVSDKETRIMRNALIPDPTL